MHGKVGHIYVRQRVPSAFAIGSRWKQISPVTKEERVFGEVLIGQDVSRDAAMTKAVFGRDFPILVSSGFARLFRGLCLPVGYPESATANYSLFVRYNLIQVSLISVTRILSTQAMLLAVGMGQAGALPMAAVVNWLLKDGLGHLGSILVGTRINTKFDSDPKRYKFLSVFLGQCANFLGILSLSRPGMFLVFTSLSSALSRIGTLAVTASRARIYEDFSLQGNLGDLIRCSQSQSTVATLLGTVVGVALAPVIGGDISWILSVFVPATVATHYMAYKAVSVIELSTFNRQRFELVMKEFLDNNIVPTYQQVALEERFILSRSLFPQIQINPQIDAAFVDMKLEENLRHLGYTIYQPSSESVVLHVSENATAIQVIEGMFNACSKTYGEDVASFPQFLEAAHSAGWRTHVAFIDNPQYRLSLVH